MSQQGNDTSRLNLPTPTLGGRQFWADEWFFHDWHIQRNVFTGHYRLLDGSNVRHAWGTLAQCRNKLNDIAARTKLPAMRGAAVVLLHGLFRSAAAMSKMARHLREQGGYTVFNVNYPTTRGSVAEHAATLDRVLQSLAGIDAVSFVAHSLGNVVIRYYLGGLARGEFAPPSAKLARIVMLGPPNDRAQLAHSLGHLPLFHLVAGQSGNELGRGWQALDARLATPPIPFGILAGGRGTPTGYNPLLGEDNDMVVSVAGTRLPGAADFAVVPALHTLIMNDRTVHQYTLRFLQHGYFRSEDARQPIPRVGER